MLISVWNEWIEQFSMQCEANTYFDMEKTGACNVGDRWSYLLSSMNDIDSESIDCISTDIVAIYPRNQHLTFVIVHE